ncbi:MAG: ABC transporter substrate-binding protein [Oscillospiraceae bacterium]|nr:ABC transporter substrate-binding protein [Oscillospiraceae bacterium]
MQTIERNAALFLAALLLLFLSGCGGTPPEKSTPDEGVTAENEVSTPDMSDAAAPDTSETTDDTSGDTDAANLLDASADFDPVTVRLAALKGPTAMGLVKLMSDADNGDTMYGNYDFTLAASPDEVAPRLIQGELDIACIPANLAAVLYNRTGGEIVTLAVNTLGVLYIVENGNAVQSIEDLRGMTVAASGKGSTPEYALYYLLRQHGLEPEIDVMIDWKSEHSECVTALATGNATIALLPQPFVTVAQNQLEDLRVALDLTREWDALGNGSALITGVAAARRSFVQEHPAAVAQFLNGYAASVEWVNDNVSDAAALIGAADIVPAPVAEKALPYCNIVCVSGNELAAILPGYLSVLHEAAPESVGGTLPESDFYYLADAS